MFSWKSVHWKFVSWKFVLKFAVGSLNAWMHGLIDEWVVGWVYERVDGWVRACTYNVLPENSYCLHTAVHESLWVKSLCVVSLPCCLGLLPWWPAASLLRCFAASLFQMCTTSEEFS